MSVITRRIRGVLGTGNAGELEDPQGPQKLGTAVPRNQGGGSHQKCTFGGILEVCSKQFNFDLVPMFPEKMIRKNVESTALVCRDGSAGQIFGLTTWW